MYKPRLLRGSMLLPLDSNNMQLHPDAQKFIQSALDALSAHIAIITETGEIIGVNVAWQNFAIENSFRHPMYGIGLNYLEVCEQASKRGATEVDKIATGLRDVITGRIPEFEMEYPCHSPTEKRWFVVRASRFYWSENICVIVAHQNISDLKQSRAEVQESKERVQAVLDNIPNAVLTITQDGQIEICNPAAARIFRYSMETLSQLSITDLMTPPHDEFAKFFSLADKRGFELYGKRSDQSHFPMYLTLNRMTLKRETSYIVNIQDITQIKQMQAEILEKEQMRIALQKERELRDLKDRVLSMMSHELKTPLAAIRLSHDMLKRYSDRATDEEKAQYFDNINLQVEHLNEMVSDVLTLSQSERAEQGFTPESIDLITYCRNIVEAFQINHYQTHQIEFECPDPIIVAEFDKKLLRRALTNLISNAIKYSPEGGAIWFKLWTDGDFALIQVIDSGIGIPQEDNEYLFSPFHRASNVKGLPGTGLGLAITKQAIDLHEGDITYDSKIGQGTTFTIRIPLTVAT